jgi:hypothetical protein
MLTLISPSGSDDDNEMISGVLSCRGLTEPTMTQLSESLPSAPVTFPLERSWRPDGREMVLSELLPALASLALGSSIASTAYR